MTFERRGNRFFDCSTQQDVTDFLAEYFRIRACKVRGGKSKSPAKQKASRRNGAMNTGKQKPSTPAAEPL
jgi:hypothetical protein